MRARSILLPVALLALVTACDSTDPAAQRPPAQGPAHEFVSRPDLIPPVVDVRTSTDRVDPGYVFLTPHVLNPGQEGDPQSGALVVGTDGEPVWALRLDQDGRFANDLSVQTYQGQQVLSYWRGVSPAIGWGEGEYVLLDQSYQEIATIRAGNGLHADLHDLVITPRNTALIVAYPTAQRDRLVREGVVQEVDIASGAVLFEWHSIDHVGLDESFQPEPEDRNEAYDYFHINSVDEDADGNLLISARQTHALYKIDRATGEVLWRLGGRRSDFALGEGVAFSWQHDARWLPSGQLSLLDNASGEDDRGPPSRALVLDVDERARTAELASGLPSPNGLTNGTQGNHRVLPSGNSFVGWGSRPYFTEFAPNGEVLLHASFPDNMFSYRAVLAEWTGRPAEPPAAVAVSEDGTDAVTVYASWNGSTEVTGWRVLTGPTADDLRPVQDAPKDGFETAIEVTGADAFVAVEALDGQGSPLRLSDPTEVAA